MIPIRTAFVTSLAVTAALAVGIPTVGADAPGDVPGAAGPCATVSAAQGQAGTAGTNNQVCTGAGTVDIGPSVGQVATVAGPTIAGPATMGMSIVSAGNVAVG